MAENLEKTKQDKKSRQASHTQHSVDGVNSVGADDTGHHGDMSTPRKEPIYLPDEILVQILEYTSHASSAQKTLASCCLLSRQWYDAALPLLYRHPRLYGNNYDLFVRAICPSINLHVRKSPLSELVKVLDMGHLVHQGSRSMTARLLGRTKGNLEEFVAPQASFAMNCFPALAKCYHLRLLDLSLVSESPPLPDLFKTVSHLEQLQTFRLPRSTGFGVHNTKTSLSFSWPTNLEHLTISGGIDANFLYGVVSLPITLKSLTIERCPLAKGFAVTHLLKTAVRNLPSLETLKISHLPRLSGHALDGVLLLLPQLSVLSVSVDYITPAIFDEGHFHHTTGEIDSIAATTDKGELLPAPLFQSFNLRLLELTSSGFSGSPSGIEEKITPIDIMIAIDDGALPKLRKVRVAQSLLWHTSSTAADADALADALKEGSKRDWENREWVFANMSEKDYAKPNCWEDVAGVWNFEG